MATPTQLYSYQKLRQEFTTLVNEYIKIDQTTTYAQNLKDIAIEKYLVITVDTNPPSPTFGSLASLVYWYFGDTLFASQFYSNELAYINYMRAYLH